jgi:head-tail adaptor
MRGPRVTVEVERLGQKPDGQGGKTREWYYLGKITGVLSPRNIKGLSAGMERVVADTTVSVTTYRLYAEHPPMEVVLEDRIKFGKRLFNIIFIGDPDSSGKLQPLDLEERT